MFLHILIHREFQSTPSAWRETTIATTQGTIDRDFNPLPPHGGRHCHACGLWLQRFYFNPLPPHGGRPWRNTANDRYQHFNPLPPHGGRRSEKCWLVLLALYFNPLPPHGGRQYVMLPIIAHRMPFQSTPSAWRETFILFVCSHVVSYQSTPSAWRETLFKWKNSSESVYFNPLPPHGGRQKCFV